MATTRDRLADEGSLGDSIGRALVNGSMTKEYLEAWLTFLGRWQHPESKTAQRDIREYIKNHVT
jgi:hypothetical protein